MLECLVPDVIIYFEQFVIKISGNLSLIYALQITNI